MKTLLGRSLLALVCLALLGPPAHARDSFRIAWSIYVGWMPWGYAADHGIVDRWADRYGIDIEIVQINDYIESINQYTAGAFDGCTMTNMDALTIPAAGGVDSTALIVGDFSNGNDGLVLRGSDRLMDVRGRDVHLVELSVSHYLLARALDSVGLRERDLRVVNTGDADIVAAYATAGDDAAVVTWNPQLAAVAAMPDAHRVFDSADIPGEIIDLLVVNSETLAAHPELGKALVGAWYETLALMTQDSPAGAAARAAMGQAAGTDRAGYEAQLATTRLFDQPAEAAAFSRAADLVRTMDRVRQFSFEHGLLGQGAPDADVVGIAFPGGTVLGDADNVKLRYDDHYMKLAADGAL